MSTSRVRRFTLALLAAVLLAALPASTALAHAALESSTPAANSVLESSPAAIVLDFDEEVEASLADIQLFDGDGTSVDIGAPDAGADATIATASLPELGDGLYAVIWRVTSSDGHVVNGAFSFQVGTAATGDGQDLLDQVQTGTGADSALTWFYGVARFLSLAGAITLLGVGLWSLQGRPAIGTRAPVRVLLWVGWTLLLVGSVASFMAFAAQVQGGALADLTDTGPWGDVASTQTGRMLLLRVALAVVLGALLALFARREEGWWKGAAATAGVLTIVSFSMAGHPNSLSPRWLWVTIDEIHLGAIVVWLGGLLALTFAGKAWMAEPEAVRPVERFSLAATVCVPLIVATGVAQTLKLAGGLDDVTSTDWGRMLLTKVMVVIAMLALAGVSRWMLRHDGASSIRRTVVAEAVLGLLVVGLAAGMVGQPPRPGVPSRPYDQVITANGIIASVSVSPGHVGGNEVHILITPPGGSLTPVASATARVLLPSADLPASPVTLVSESPNHFSGSITFPKSGDWTFELVVQVTDTDSSLLQTVIPIP
jgi:copper transport protein